MTHYVRVSGAWKVASAKVKVLGAWKSTNVWVKVLGSWKLVTDVPPPVYTFRTGAVNDYGPSASISWNSDSTITLLNDSPITWKTPAGGESGFWLKVTRTSGMSFVGFGISNATYVQLSSSRTISITSFGGTIRFSVGNWVISTTASDADIVASGTYNLTADNTYD